MEREECKDEGHTCDQTHSCPEPCTADGVCEVEIQQRAVKKTFVTGTSDTFEYDLCAKPIAKQKRCVIRIPEGKFRHDGDDHKCSVETVRHICNETCNTCGYYCELKFGHNGRHDCFHGNMRKAKFYAAKNALDTGNNRRYKVGDRGIAEMCHMFCERQGRGHIHLELCPYAKKNEQCAELKDGSGGIRHQSRKYMPSPNLEKDEVKHSKYWSRKNWKDPCRPELAKTFEKCPYECSHPIHKERSEKGEEDQEKFCTKNLWHRTCDTSTGHSFGCYHPFSNAHVIFICDISNSMGWRDGGKCVPDYKFIKDSGSLDNRLGALYSSIHKFILIRTEKGYNDIVSAVMTPRKPKAFAAKRRRASKTFVKDYLLKFKYVGMMSSSENYGEAFEDAESVIKESQDTVIIFFTDGNSEDNGAKERVRLLKAKMKQKLKLFCITLGPKNYKKDNSTVKAICKAAGDGHLDATLTGDELGATFTSIAKQMTLGTFSSL